MKAVAPLFIVFVLALASACQKQADHRHDHGSEEGPNQKLYREVMDIHDEVMPKMNDLYKTKTSLSKRLKDNPDLSDNEKKKINERIALIDSASDGMMVWMRQFNPPPDSAGEEKARAYLENELIKVKKVREDILDALRESQ